MNQSGVEAYSDFNDTAYNRNSIISSLKNKDVIVFGNKIRLRAVNHNHIISRCSKTNEVCEQSQINDIDDKDNNIYIFETMNSSKRELHDGDKTFIRQGKYYFHTNCNGVGLIPMCQNGDDEQKILKHKHKSSNDKIVERISSFVYNIIKTDRYGVASNDKKKIIYGDDVIISFGEGDTMIYLKYGQIGNKLCVYYTENIHDASTFQIIPENYDVEKKWSGLPTNKTMNFSYESIIDASRYDRLHIPYNSIDNNQTTYARILGQNTGSKPWIWYLLPTNAGVEKINIVSNKYNPSVNYDILFYNSNDVLLNQVTANKNIVMSSMRIPFTSYEALVNKRLGNRVTTVGVGRESGITKTSSVNVTYTNYSSFLTEYFKLSKESKIYKHKEEYAVVDVFVNTFVKLLTDHTISVDKGAGDLKTVLLHPKTNTINNSLENITQVVFDSNVLSKINVFKVFDENTMYDLQNILSNTINNVTYDNLKRELKQFVNGNLTLSDTSVFRPFIFEYILMTPKYIKMCFNILYELVIEKQQDCRDECYASSVSKIIENIRMYTNDANPHSNYVRHILFSMFYSLQHQIHICTLTDVNMNIRKIKIISNTPGKDLMLRDVVVTGKAIDYNNRIADRFNRKIIHGLVNLTKVNNKQVVHENDLLNFSLGMTISFELLVGISFTKPSSPKTNDP
jgi:hypothetical protein